MRGLRYEGVFPELRGDVSGKQPRQVRVVLKGQVAGNRHDLEIGAHRKRPGAVAVLDARCDLFHRLDRPAPYPSLVHNLGRHGVRGVAPVRDYPVDANLVISFKCLALGVDRCQGQHRRLQGVNPLVWSAACVSRFAEKAHVMDKVSVAGAADDEPPLRTAGACVDHHGHVNVIEYAEPNHLLLAGEQANLAGLPQRPSHPYVDELFCRGREERHPAGERRCHLRYAQPYRGSDKRAQLRVMPAGVRRPGLRVRPGMSGRTKGVQFTDNPNRGPAAVIRPHPL